MKKIVLIGGGHGLSNLVEGFKDEEVDLTIIVASTDDGGHTGKIRKEFDIVAVGDLRMVLSQLIDEKSSLKDIFDYRFNSLHGENKVSLGNLMITSLWMKYKDIDKVIEYINSYDNLYCAGRNGQHRYNNIDHSMLTGVEIANNIINGITSRDNIWNINTEKEYHEIKLDNIGLK